MLAILDPERDIVVHLLTSRPHGRPEQPRCFHGTPYAGYFIPGGELERKTWVDLRPCDDLYRDHCHIRQKNGLMTLVLELDADTICSAIECTAGAEDTTRQQESLARDVLAAMR